MQVGCALTYIRRSESWWARYVSRSCLDLLIALNSGVSGMRTVRANSACVAVTKMRQEQVPDAAHLVGRVVPQARVVGDPENLAE
jgi:hypothetical protein